MCRQLCPYIAYNNTQLRSSISVEKWVAITLWTLASPVDYRIVSHLFGVGRSTVCEIVLETCQAIVDHLLRKYIFFPSPENQQSTSTILSKSGVFHSVLGSDIPVSPPTACHTDYFGTLCLFELLLITGTAFLKFIQGVYMILGCWYIHHFTKKS